MLSPTYELATALCHTDEIVTPTYEIGELWLCHTDEMLSPTYDLTTVVMSYGGVNKSSV